MLTEDRHGQKATIIISQLPVADWYDVMKGNTTAADAILDRLVHTSVRFELKGASLRQKNVSNQTENKLDITILGQNVKMMMERMNDEGELNKE